MIEIIGQTSIIVAIASYLIICMMPRTYEIRAGVVSVVFFASLAATVVCLIIAVWR